MILLLLYLFIIDYFIMKYIGWIVGVFFFCISISIIFGIIVLIKRCFFCEYKYYDSLNKKLGFFLFLFIYI